MKAEGLGALFLHEVDHQVERLATNPLHFPEVFRELRRVRLRTFPYSLYFRPTPDGLYVMACFHSSRDPRVWQGRT
jgi:toxin ParE1/3/4